jgi:hypothetical protein
MVPALMLAVLCSTVGVAFKRIQKDVKPLNFIEFSCAIFFGRKKKYGEGSEMLGVRRGPNAGISRRWERS